MLADWEIEALAKKGMIEPFDPQMLGPCGYDFQLSHELMLSCSPDDEDVCWFGRANVSVRVRNMRVMCIPAPCVDIPPHKFVLAWTYEYWKIPTTIVGLVQSARSRYEGQGLMCRPAKMQPGWKGRLLVEMYNQSEDEVRVYLDQSFAEVSFVRLDQKPERSYRGQYQNQGEV